MYVNQAFSPVLVALRPQQPLTPHRRRITIRRQSGGGPLHLPRCIAADQVLTVEPKGRGLSPLETGVQGNPCPVRAGRRGGRHEGRRAHMAGPGAELRGAWSTA